ncbi:hypothetical protein KSH_05875 [Moraxella osloensis]|nr:hypothetical protein [Moraxella osloensis]ATQ85375.1 hypothetical protein KSH_05875 [Moraxella osloensis]
MKILTVLGARPQFIKAAAFSRAIKKHDCFLVIFYFKDRIFEASLAQNSSTKKLHLRDGTYLLCGYEYVLFIRKLTGIY